MRNTTSQRNLDEQIEQLIREHIATIQRTAREAMDRAFAGVASAGRKLAPTTRLAAATGNKRRARTEIAAIGERLYRTVCARPGEGIVALASELGVSARELHRKPSSNGAWSSGAASGSAAGWDKQPKM